MSTYTEFTLTHFDECTGGTFRQDYRWSVNDDGLIELEANAGTGGNDDWIFEQELENQRDLKHWLKQQERESKRAKEIWESDD